MEPQSRTFQPSPASALSPCPYAGCGQIADALHELRQPASSLALLLAILERKAQDPALSPALRAAQGAIERLGVLLPALPLACLGQSRSSAERSAPGYLINDQECSAAGDPMLGYQAELWPTLAPGINPGASAQGRATSAPQELTLIVEDHADVAAALAALLEDSGRQVRIAADADEAAAVLGSGLEFGAVIADFGLPGTRSGLDVLALASHKLPRPILVLISGDCSPELAVRARHSGLSLLNKPLRADELLAVLGP
ncbi:MAG: response regulator [Burkholderiaceae bacterium]|nr:response regulator [Burkholderiaceae bacterium]